MKLKSRTYLLLFFITLLGGIIRFWNLGHLPPSLNWDEISHGYNAYSILKTGRDEWGTLVPHIFRAFGDYKLPVYIYSTILPVLFFGLKAFAVRFISAMAGTLAIPGIYLLSKKIFKGSEKLHLISAFILALTPWHIFISRPALEANLALTFIIYGSYYLIRFFEKESGLLPPTLFFGLSLHTYNTARVFVPLLILWFLIVYRPKLSRFRSQFFPLTVFALFLGLVVYQVYSGVGTARYEKLKILSDANVYQIGQKRQESQYPPLVSKIIYNRPIFFVTQFAKNYFSYFSPQFFFQSKGAQYQFAIPGQNLFTLPILLLAIAGLVISIREFTKTSALIIGWLLLSPVAAALTLDPPQALRPNPMIIAIVLLAVVGFKRINGLLSWLALILFVFFSLWFLKTYWYQYSYQYSQSWQYGYFQALDYISKNSDKYQNVFITKRLGEAHIYYAFYNRTDPKVLQPGGDSIRYQKSDWFWTDKINNVYFINDWDIPTTKVTKLKLESGGEVDTTGGLLVTSPAKVPQNAKVLEVIRFLDGEPVFIICSIP